MVEALTKKVIQAFKVKCKGVNLNNTPCFNEGENDDVIIKVYEHGWTVPLCRFAYCATDAGFIKCNSKLQNVSSAEEHNLGDCPYSTK